MNLVGGLGDVAGALPKALARRGHRVMVMSSSFQYLNRGISFQMSEIEFIDTAGLRLS